MKSLNCSHRCSLVLCEQLNTSTHLLLLFIDSTDEVGQSWRFIKEQTNSQNGSKSRLVVLKVLGSTADSRSMAFQRAMRVGSIACLAHLVVEEMFGSQNCCWLLNWLLNKLPKSISVQTAATKLALIEQGKESR